MEKEIYVDQVSNIFVNGNMVRIDFACMNPATHDHAGQPVFEHKVRLIMPVEAFTNGLSMQENILAQLIERGVLAPPANTAL